jgi:Leucine-rich repeat (LRR) protein
MVAWKTFALLTPTLLCALPADAGTEPAKALAAIKKLGGKVQTEESGRVVGIDLSGTQATDDDLKLLAGFKTLRTLNLFNTKIMGPGLAHLKGLYRLEELDLSWPLLGYADAVGDSYRPRPLDEKSLKHLKGFPALRSLNLQYTQLGEEGLQHLAGLKTLRELDLGLVQVTDMGLRHLQGLTELTDLDLRNAPVTDGAAATLGRLEKLRELGLSGTRIGDEGLRQLKRLAFLEELYVSGTRITDAGLAHLGNLTNLRALYLNETAVTGTGLSHLKELKDLRRLYLAETAATDDGLRSLRGLPRLEVLDLSWTKITGAGLGPLKALNRLQDLRLDGIADDAVFRRLAELDNLRALSLNRTELTDAALAQLGRLRKLTRLKLAGTNVTDAGLARLKAFPELASLTLGGSGLTDAGLKHLRDLAPLRELWLSQGAEFTDKGLAQLRTARPRLRVYQNVFIPSSPFRAATKAEDGVKVRGTVSVLISANRPGEKVKKAVAGAAVHLRDLPKSWKPKPPAESVVLHFRKGRIYPEFACLAVGQRVIVRAEDGERFALRAPSRARGEFGALVSPNDREFTDSFPKPDDFVSLTCALHPNAKAHLQVVPTPVFALCDAAGKFTLLERLPKGEHVLRAFLPGVGWGEKAIALRGDEGEVVVEVELAPRSKVQAPRDKEGPP